MGNTFVYELTEEADNYLQGIFIYTSERFGDDQAIKYLKGLKDVFLNLCKHPHSGRTRNEIKTGLRSIT